MNTLTRKQLHRACKSNKYIAVRWFDGVVTAINCKIADHARFDNVNKGNQLTNLISWRPCSFQEYISLKTPFYGKTLNKKINYN